MTTRRTAPTLKPLGRSTAANRQLPSTAPPPADAPLKPRTAPARTKDIEQADARSPAERARDAMKTVNTALASLAALNKSGFRAASASSPSSSASTSRSGSAVRAAPSSASLRAGAAQNATRDKVEQAAKEAGRALRELRTLAAEGVLGRKKVDVEKAAGGVVAHLVEMEMYRLAVVELSTMRSSLLSWWAAPTPARPPPAASSLSHLPSLFVPLPPASFFAPPSLSDTLSPFTARPTLAEIVPLVLALQQYLLGSLLRSPEVPAAELAAQLAYLLSDEGGPLAWRALWAREGPAQELESAEREGIARRLDAMMTSLFATVTKGCASLDGQTAPEHLLSLRTYALLCYASTAALSSPDKLSAFHDQLRKVLLLYGRAAEGLRYSATKIGAEVKGAFERVVGELEARGLLQGAEKEDRKWRELCEVVLHIARRADDLAFISRVSTLLGISSSPASSPSAAPASPAVQTTHLCAKIANSLAAFESSLRTPAPAAEVADALRHLLGALPLLTPLRLRLLPAADVPRADRTKIDKLVDRARFVLARYAKRDIARVDQLMRPAGEAPPRPLSEVDALVCEALDALAVHAEGLVLAPSSTASGEEEVVTPPERDHHALGAVDSLLLLAYASVDLSSPSPSSRALALLDRARALVDPPEGKGPALRRAYSLRTLASACYNIGGTLFNAGRAADALGFVRRACEIGERVLRCAMAEGLLEAEGEGDVLEGIAELKLGEEEELSEEERERRRKEKEEMRDAARDFERLMGRRWELLALTQHQVGDKKAAYDAYIASALSQPASTFSTLAADSSSHPFSSILATHAPLYKLIQRLTRLAVFDLLLPGPSIPLTTTSSARTASLPAAARGALLEMQLAALEPYSEKPEARSASDALLAALEGTYEVDEYPLRRARVLVRRLQACAIGGRKERREVVGKLAEEIKALCERETSGYDAPLRPFISQYLALSHLFLAFHAHASHAPTPALNEAVASSARQALSILRTALDGELPLSPSAVQAKRASPAVARTAAPAPATSPPKPELAASTRARRPTRAAATPARTRTLTASTRRAAAPAPAPPPTAQVTPPRRTRGKVELKDSTSARTPVRVAETGRLLLDDVERVYALLDSMVSLLGTLGELLLKIAYLKFLRRLSAKLPQNGSGNAYVTASAHLAREYLRLGKTSRAGIVLAQAESRIQTAAKGEASVSAAAQVSHWLSYAEYLALLGSHDRSAHAYDTALSLVEGLEEDAAATSTTAKIVERTLLLQRASLASSVCSVILQRKGELSRSIAPAMQAMRLGTRALNNISRLAPAPASTTSQDDSTFNAAPTDHKTALADAAPINKRKSGTTLAGGVHACLSWQLAEGLLDAILRVASLHFVRGTPKSADFFAQQALDLAEDLGAPRQMARALAVQTDVRLYWGKLDEAAAGLERVEELLGSTTCPEAAEFRRLQADLHHRASLHQEAWQFYLAAQSSLDTFVSSASDGDAGHSPVKQHTPGHHLSPAQRRASGPTVHFAAFSPSPAARSGPTPDWVLPSAQAYLLRMQIHLLRLQKKPEEAKRLVRRLARLAALEEDKADELRLLASTQLQDLLVRCTSDPVLGMLPDSVLSMPVLGMSAAGAGAVVKIGTPRTGPTVLNAIKDIEALLARAITFSSSRSHPAKLRELAAMSTTLRAMQASVGKVTKRTSATVAHVLDLGAAVALRREMLDAVEHKLAAHARQDDLTWPTVELSAPSAKDNDHRALLHAFRDRYRLETPEPTLVEAPLSALLPPSWSALTLHLTPERDSLIVCRHRRDVDPLVFKLPLDRLARREGDEDEAFTYEVAAAELKDIIAASNAGTQNAKNVDGKEARTAWWAERKELDERLGTLLQMMEDAWLGAFKSVFCDARQHDAGSFAAFKSRIERILKRSMVRAAGDKRSTRFRVEDSIVECLAALPSTSREEDLEDLFYFMAESFQFSGVPLACDETDVDQVVVDLREALEELHGTKSAPKSRVNPDEHTFLVLDKDLQAFPWESLPCLQGRSVSRLPSLAFLRDRLDLAAARAAPDAPPHEVIVDPSRTSFVLNPGGDLKNTQKTFEPWLEEQTQERAWTGVTARAPMEEEVKSALLNKELFLFFGHGGAEQYIRSQMIRHLPRCAVTMLWGCSSGLLKDQGDFEPVGTPYHYMVAGCPALVANLWDVTDKDIDKFAFSVFRLTGIAAPSPDSPLPSPAAPPATLTAAVAQSRGVCNLRFLNGAAPVVYGIPVRFATPTEP
ncbi:separin protein [Rhodotorula kratochvilovae]